MILKNCHVENFGKISNLDLDFSSGLNSFCEQNGYGKSTISTFLRVMFYGLKTATKNGGFSDREHYYPFNGGKFGGSLTFINNGKTYRIERFFDVKSETKDTFKLYEDGNESTAYSESIGEELFGLDETSFKKTVFFGEVYEEVLATSTINARLNNVVYDMGDGGYDKAVSILDKSRKRYKADRGNGGELLDLKNQIASVKKEIERLRAIENSLPTKYKEIKELSIKVEDLEKSYEELQKQKLANSKKEHYKKLLAISSAEKQKADGLLTKYNGKFLEDGEQIVLREVDEKLKELKGEKRALAFSEEKKNLLNELDGALKDLSAEKLQRVKNEYLDIENSKSDAKKTSLIIPAILCFSLGVIIAVVLTIMKINLGFIAGIVGLIVGGALLFIDRQNNKAESDKKGEENKKLNKIYEFLSAYGEGKNGATLGFENLQRKISTFNSLYLELQTSQSKIKDIEREIEIISTKSKVILARYGAVDDVISFIVQSNTAKREYDLAYKNYIKYSKEAEDYYKENRLDNQNFAEIDSEELLKTQLSTAKNTLALKNKELNLLELEVDNLADNLSMLDKIEEKLKKATFKHDSIIKTLEVLKTCSKRLNDKYVEPIKERFVYYSEKIEKSLGEKIYMDKDYKVSFERGGEIRSDKHLSAGQKAILDLCLRLALIDNVFKKTSPFILLDDSFSLLDESHMENVKKLLKELASDKQILYFTCHRSRAI